MLDVAVHADGAAMHDAANTLVGRDVDEITNSGCVDRTIGRLRDAGLPVHGGDVIDDLDVLHRVRKRRTIAERAHNRLNVVGFEFSRL
jgi:hypothetical protein